MAGDWIMVRIDLRDDPAVIAIAKATRKDVDLIVGKLIRIWGWANRNTVDGISHHITSQWVDRHVECKGFADAMSAAGWLINTGDSIQFPHYERYNGAPAKRRVAARVRKRMSRAKRDKCHKNVTPDEDARAEQVAISSPSSLPLGSDGSEKDEWPASKIPPPVEVVRDFCADHNLVKVDADLFVDTYAAQGWKLSNGNHMKDWQAAARKWNKNQYATSPNSPKPIARRTAVNQNAAEGFMQMKLPGESHDTE